MINDEPTLHIKAVANNQTDMSHMLLRLAMVSLRHWGKNNVNTTLNLKPP